MSKYCILFRIKTCLFTFCSAKHQNDVSAIETKLKIESNHIIGNKAVIAPEVKSQAPHRKPKQTHKFHLSSSSDEDDDTNSSSSEVTSNKLTMNDKNETTRPSSLANLYGQDLASTEKTREPQLRTSSSVGNVRTSYQSKRPASVAIENLASRPPIISPPFQTVRYMSVFILCNC